MRKFLIMPYRKAISRPLLSSGRGALRSTCSSAVSNRRAISHIYALASCVRFRLFLIRFTDLRYCTWKSDFSLDLFLNRLPANLVNAPLLFCGESKTEFQSCSTDLTCFGKICRVFYTIPGILNLSELPSLLSMKMLRNSSVNEIFTKIYACK